jgi:hypothetical protein
MPGLRQLRRWVSVCVWALVFALLRRCAETELSSGGEIVSGGVQKL